MGIKISELNEALEAENEDLVPVVDVDANATKKITVLNLSKKNAIPTGSIMGYDGDTVPSGYEEVDGPNDYSTTEQRIGTWIDGKPLYRKVVTHTTTSDIGSTTTVTNYDVSHNISDIDKVVNARGFLYVSGNYTPLGNGGLASNGHTWSNQINYVSNTTLRIRITYAIIPAGTFYFVLEYTKTTD